MGILINHLFNDHQRRSIMRTLRIATMLLFVMVLCSPITPGQITVQKDKLNALATALSTAPAGSVLLLERGGLYPNVGVVTVTVPVTLQATGTGKRPVVFQTAKTDGTYDVRDFQLNAASFTAIGIHFDADHGDNSWTRYGLSSGVANIVLRFDGCAFSNYFGRTIDLLTADNKAFFTDCIWAGDVKRTGFDEGRPIDARQFGHDTVFVQNCTFQNVTDRFFRHYTGAGYLPLDVVIFDHCTFAYGYNYRPGFQFGTIKNLQFTNNLVVDPGMMGTEPYTIRKNEVDYAEGDIRVFSAVKVDSLQTKILMSNNNIYVEQPILDIFKANKDSISQAQWFNAEFRSKIDTSKAMFSESLTFTNPAGAPITVITQFAKSPRTPITATGMNLRHPDSVSYAYPTSARSYTAGAGGFPVGDLNWFPTRKAAWITAGKPISAVENVASVPREFSLSQNYPNPFNPTTTIEYTLAQNSHVVLNVFDVLGREVACLVDNMQQGGTLYRVTFDASRLASGVYFYRLQSGASSIVKSLVLMK
jgi:hypothetical protein